VFPFAAAALGVPGGSAIPSTDWDNEPANFFNDFGGCSGKSSDCYRSETYAAPLHGGEMTEYRTVGFDVDRNAHSVSVYIVVAADLRDNPIHETTMLPGAMQCGVVERRDGAETSINVAGDLFSAGFFDDGNRTITWRLFCGFNLPADFAGASVKQATLRMHQRDANGSPFPAVVDHVDFGPELDAADYSTTPLAANMGMQSNDETIGYRELDVTAAVQDDASSGRSRSQFRVVLLSPEPNSFVSFSRPEPNAPELVVVWRQY
jgi:hypothetical protein